ncbi:MAG: family aminopeptidase, partial [Cellulosimicrobium sp.]|nr:family aminopeptidase [Cellulosimicrobium sp.]
MSTPSTPVTDPTLHERAHAHAQDLATFVEASPSSYHAAHEVARRLEAAGFERLDET